MGKPRDRLLFTRVCAPVETARLAGLFELPPDTHRTPSLNPPLQASVCTVGLFVSVERDCAVRNTGRTEMIDCLPLPHMHG